MTDIPQDTPGRDKTRSLPPDHDVDAVFAERLRALRMAVGTTQAQLAERMTAAGFSMHQTTVAKCEAGDRPVTIGEAVQFARILGVDLAALTAESQPEDAEMNEAMAHAMVQLKFARAEVLAIRRRVMDDVTRLAGHKLQLDNAEAFERGQAQLARELHRALTLREKK